jgi:hypothetical protein
MINLNLIKIKFAHLTLLMFHDAHACCLPTMSVSLAYIRRNSLKMRKCIDCCQWQHTSSCLLHLQYYGESGCVSRFNRKQNVGLSLSAAVELSFSIVGMTGTAIMNSLRPRLFGSLLLLRVSDCRLNQVKAGYSKPTGIGYNRVAIQ